MSSRGFTHARRARQQRIDAAFGRLASLYEYGELRLATDPAALLEEVCEELEAGRRLRDTAAPFAAWARTTLVPEDERPDDRKVAVAGRGGHEHALTLGDLRRLVAGMPPAGPPDVEPHGDDCECPACDAERGEDG